MNVSYPRAYTHNRHLLCFYQVFSLELVNLQLLESEFLADGFLFCPVALHLCLVLCGQALIVLDSAVKLGQLRLQSRDLASEI